MKFLLRLALVHACAGFAPAVAQLVSLHAPLAPARAGSSVALELIVLNASADALHYNLPSRLDGRLSDAAANVWPVNLQTTAAVVDVPAAGFARVPVAFQLPGDARGRLVLELYQPVPLRTVLDVAEFDPADAAKPSPAALAGGEVLSNASPALPAASRLKRYYADHFSAHEPFYFVGGEKKPAVKFQLSLKYRLLNDSGPLATHVPALKGLHLAYTQRSLWDITSDSSPFFDSSYMPELLYESLAPDTGNRRGFTWIGWQMSVQHESNGRDGDASRSLNTLYFRPMFVLGDLDGWRLILRPKFFVYLSDLTDNATLKDYRGYSELRAIFGKANRLSLSFTGRLGADFEKGSLQIDATYPTEFMTGNFALYLMLQYWTGHGESLLRYDQRSESVRAGFSLAR